VRISWRDGCGEGPRAGKGLRGGSSRARALVVGLLALSALAAALGSLAVRSHSASAAAPSGVTVTAGGGAQTFGGGPITGSADGSGFVAPVVCQPPACESFPLKLVAPVGTPAKSLVLSVGITFNPQTGNPGGTGLDGLDLYVLDANGSVVASNQLGSSPSTVKAGGLDVGTYTVEVSGENGAVMESYDGTASAVVSPPAVTPAVPQTTLGFGAPTLVSPTILGAEPQISFERPMATVAPGAALDPNRGFVDWPVSSRSNIGTLWRTINGGATYRQIVDPSCAPRNVPNCYTGGGGDTVNRVNNYDGTVNFGDQEAVAQEAFASSVDHGDTFPLARQTAVTSTFTGVDRQWISTVDAPGFMADPASSVPLEAIYSYHIPGAGQLVAGVGTDGIVRPAVPVLPMVSQSGPSRIDTQPGSPGFGWFYQGYRDGSGFEVGAAPLGRYQDPTAYHVGNVTSDQPAIFPWISLDRQGNLYAVWVTKGNVYMSTSMISDPANNPKATPAGVPATKWSPKVQVNPSGLSSTVFPEVVAGDAGRVAVVYDATSDYAGVSDGAPATATWNTYMSISTNALDPHPSFELGQVSHRPVHIGSICTSGTTCTGDRSLLDMIDVTLSSQGRVSTVFSDNNNAFARDTGSPTQLGSPFVKVAQLIHGPSLFANAPGFDITPSSQCTPAASGDATWPNMAGAANLPGLDITGSCVGSDGANLVARVDLTDASAKAMAAALQGYNAARGNDAPAARLQYVVRWESGTDSYYVVAEAAADGTLSYYGGKLSGADAVNNANAAVAVTYRPQDGVTVTGHREGNTLVLSVPLGQVAAASGRTLFGTQAFSLAGPSDMALAGQPASQQVFTAMRNVDAAPALDVVLAALPVTPPTLGGGGGTPTGGPGGTGSGGGTAGNQPGPGGTPRQGGKHKPSTGQRPTRGACPPATGSLGARSLGRLSLRMNRVVVRRRLPRARARVPADQDVLCLRGFGIRAAYATPGVLRLIPPRKRSSWSQRVVVLLTANRHYALRGVRPGTALRQARRKLHLGRGFRFGPNQWYLVALRGGRGLLKVRRGVVEEVGIIALTFARTEHEGKATVHGLGV